ncbi:ImpA family metalloprotease [Colwellia sp. 12G3]|uniref:ImpA family metalloprotease n=1 Tax=Colwellia sp. 12G3 TaxID=2058299 RepID=UPI000C320868|nr:ImpA family metalloprotease [Colwellia sp. 12G3]PKI14003.1 hypothetical protein CXF71_15570 [Colwellia sp. 12G3]
MCTTILFGCGSGSEETAVSNPPEEIVPDTDPVSEAITVDAGTDITLYNNEVLTLTGSTNLAGLSYLWSQVSGDTVIITSHDSASATVALSNIAHDSKLVFKLTVSDSKGNSEADSITVIVQDKVSAAMISGDPSLLPDTPESILNRILSVIEAEKIENEQALQAIYGDSSISYLPSQHSQFVSFKQREGVYPLIRGNKGLNLAAAVNINGQHNAAFGTNIIRSFYDGAYLEYEPHFANLLAWLLKRDSATLADKTTVKLALMDGTTAWRTSEWLTAKYTNWTVTHCTIESELNNCLSDADLVITGSNNDASSEIALAALQSAQANDAALLYVHLHSWNSNALTVSILSQMNLIMQGSGGPGNYFSQDTATWDNYQQMLAAGWELNDIYQLVTDLKAKVFSFDISSCATTCDDAFNSDFKAIVQSLRISMNGFDRDKVDIFASELYQIEKLLVLLADFYRQSISYPMNVGTTPANEFLQAYFADHLVYNTRDFNMLQKDLGNFSRTDFSHVTPSSKTLNITSKVSFRSTGVYALPGQTMTISRTDNSEVDVSVFINTQRSASTHEFDGNGYNRPKYLQSVAVSIESGETITLNSPYGGPVQLKFSVNDKAVAINFSNIGQHPHWASASDNESFAEKMTAADFDWAEIVTPNFEIHSQLPKMNASLSNVYFPSAAEIAAGTEQYIHNFAHVLAGFQGPGIDVVAEIHDFANDKGWSIDSIDYVKHMNADQPTCGSGCSGNPYDAGWNFSPIGHGDIHEFGHGLEKSKFRFSGWDGHASTNPYSYYAKTQFHKLTNTASSCQSLPSQDMFNTLKASLLEADAFAHMQAASLTSWSQGMAIYVQMMMAAQEQGDLLDGWHLLARLHILLREFERADNNDNDWLAKRDSLGFGSFTRAEAQALNNNDWLVIAISTVTVRDYRELLTMWGLSFSSAASSQVASFAYAPITPTFYNTSGNDYCLGLDKAPIAINDRDGDGIIDADDIFPDDPNESNDADGDGIGDNQDLSYDLDPTKLTYQNIELQSKSNTECLSIDAGASLAGQKIVSAVCSNDNNTLWNWGDDGQLHTAADASMCIAVDSLGNGAQLILASCADINNQAWAYNNDSKAVTSVNFTGLAFDLYGNKEVHLYNTHGGSNQQWLITVH